MNPIKVLGASLTAFAIGLGVPSARADMAGEAIAVAARALDVPVVVQPAPWRVVSALSLTSPHPDFGGFSGLVMGPDCRAVAISDAGFWLTFTPVHRDGQPSGIVDARLGALRGPDGAPLGPKRLADAEALARLADGGLLVGFERDHRLWHYDGAFGTPRALDAPPALAGLPPNRGIEAAAMLPDGRLLLLAEGGADDAGLPAWIGAPGDWRRLAYPFDGDFRPTALTLGPGGQAVVLERAFSRWRGVRLRLQAVTVRDDGIALSELARIAGPIPADNGEALAWVPGGPDGRGGFYVLSDDNFSGLQRTILWRIAPADRPRDPNPCG